MQRGWKVAHKAAAVGQVDVVRACFGGSLGHAVGLRLERPGCVNDQAYAPLAQCGGQAGGLVVQRHTVRAVAQCVGQGLGARGIAARHHQCDAVVACRVTRQRATDACAKVAVAPKDQCFERSHGSGAGRTRHGRQVPLKRQLRGLGCAGLVQQGLQRCALWLHLRLVPDRHIAGGKGSAEQVTLDAV